MALPRPGHAPYEVDMAVSFNAPLEMMTDDWIRSEVDVLRECLS
jgi:hypothetical protein